MQWRWIEEGIVMLMGVLGIWPVIAGIREAEWLRIEGWIMEEEESREILNIQII